MIYIQCFYHLYTPKGATMQALLKYDTLNEVKPRGTLFLLEPLSINVLVFAFVQKFYGLIPDSSLEDETKQLISEKKITPH